MAYRSLVLISLLLTGGTDSSAPARAAEGYDVISAVNAALANQTLVLNKRVPVLQSR